MQKITLAPIRETFAEEKPKSRHEPLNLMDDLVLKDRLVYSVKRMLEAQEVLAKFRSDSPHIPGLDPERDLKTAEASVSFRYHRKEVGKIMKEIKAGI